MSCTSIRAMVDCTAVDVAVAGGRVALHCYSAEGRTIVRLSFEEFAAKLRGERDCNGNRFPAPRALTEEQFNADAEIVPITKHKPGSRPARSAADGRLSDPARLAQYRAAWARREADGTPLRIFAAEIGVSESSVCGMFKKFEREEADARARGPVVKPNGKLL